MTDHAAWIRTVCEANGLTVPADLDATSRMLDAMVDVENTVTGGTNALALGRLANLDPEDDDMVRVGHYLAALNARERLEQRRQRDGRPNPRCGPRDGEALAEGVTAGAEFALALLRTTGRIA